MVHPDVTASSGLGTLSERSPTSNTTDSPPPAGWGRDPLAPPSLLDMSHHPCGDATTTEIARYLDELVKDMREVNALPGVFPHALRLLNEEIDRVWQQLYQPQPSQLPAPQPWYTATTEGRAGAGRDSAPPPPLVVSAMHGRASALMSASASASAPKSAPIPLLQLNKSPPPPAVVPKVEKVEYSRETTEDDAGVFSITEKIPMPYHPRCNFIGRILGPRGISVKQLESESDCNILIRGRGSVKNTDRESRLLNQPGWEHLSEALHILVKASDTSKHRAEAKLRRGVDAITRLLTTENDEHKRRQLVQLAIINGTYRSDKP